MLTVAWGKPVVERLSLIHNESVLESTPVGVTEVSRWLSAATPPVEELELRIHPGGMTESLGKRSHSGIPPGCGTASQHDPVVSLRSTTGHRLRPLPGSGTSVEDLCIKGHKSDIESPGRHDFCYPISQG